LIKLACVVCLKKCQFERRNDLHLSKIEIAHNKVDEYTKKTNWRSNGAFTAKSKIENLVFV